MEVRHQQAIGHLHELLLGSHSWILTHSIHPAEKIFSWLHLHIYLLLPQDDRCNCYEYWQFLVIFSSVPLLYLLTIRNTWHYFYFIPSLSHSVSQMIVLQSEPLRYSPAIPDLVVTIVAVLILESACGCVSKHTQVLFHSFLYHFLTKYYLWNMDL